MNRFWLPCIILLGHALVAAGHEMPDGEIDRRVQVVGKTARGMVEDSLGMNGATLEKELVRLGKKPAATFSAKWKQYQDAILPSLAKRMRLTVDGDRVSLEPVRADHSGWSHLHLTCLLRAEVPLTEQPKKIVGSDGNFLDDPGNYRIAMKGRSGVKIDKANDPPIVTKAKPVQVTELTNQNKRRKRSQN